MLHQITRFLGCILHAGLLLCKQADKNCGCCTGCGAPGVAEAAHAGAGGHVGRQGELRAQRGAFPRPRELRQQLWRLHSQLHSSFPAQAVPPVTHQAQLPDACICRKLSCVAVLMTKASRVSVYRSQCRHSCCMCQPNVSWLFLTQAVTRLQRAPPLHAAASCCFSRFPKGNAVILVDTSRREGRSLQYYSHHCTIYLTGRGFTGSSREWELVADVSLGAS
jgi:hypothetical protein